MQHTGFSLGIARGLSRSVVCWVLSFLDQGLIVSPLPWKADPSVVSTTGAGGKSLEVFFLLHFFSQSFVKRNRVNFLSLLIELISSFQVRNEGIHPSQWREQCRDTFPILFLHIVDQLMKHHSFLSPSPPSDLQGHVCQVWVSHKTISGHFTVPLVNLPSSTIKLYFIVSLHI